MEQTKVPAEAVELYTRYIHGEVSRRDFFVGVKRFAFAGLTAAAIVEALMPNYALGQQVAKDDERIKATYETVPSPNGNGFIRGYLVRPFSADSRSETPTQLPGVIVVHENRGLNPHTEDVARRFALENFIAFAPDALTTRDDSRRLSERRLQRRPVIPPDRSPQDDPGFRRRRAMVEITSRLYREHRRNRFCFGGGISNTLAVLLGRIWQRPPRFMAARPCRRTCRKSQRQCSYTMARSIHGWLARIPRMRRNCRETTSRTKATFIRNRFMVSSMTPRRHATTRPRRSRHGRAPLSGSTNTCAEPRPKLGGTARRAGVVPKPHLFR